MTWKVLITDYAWPNIEVEKKITALIKEEMMSVRNSDLHSFSTPLTVDINVGNNWGLLH